MYPSNSSRQFNRYSSQQKNSNYSESGGSCAEVIRQLGYMFHDEGSVQLGIRILQEHCLAGGLTVNFPGNIPPTASFAKHIKRYYLPFCRLLLFKHYDSQSKVY